MAEDDVFEDDSDLNESFEKKDTFSKSKETVIIRVEQYLTTCKLGRLAFVAGDKQLAKDRFNLAMNLEFLTEMESLNDFGVTGGLLRDELNKRSETKSSNEVATESDKRLANTLVKLKNIFVMADERAAFNTADTNAFMLMGAALCMIGEWNKAEAIYKEGIAASPKQKCKELETALSHLNKAKDMFNLIGCTQTTSYGTLPRKSKRSSSRRVFFFNDQPVIRSRSFSSDLDTISKKSGRSTPPPVSPLVGIPSPTSSPTSSPKRMSGLQRLFKRDKSRPTSMFVDGGMMPHSKSIDDFQLPSTTPITANGGPVPNGQSLGIWRERSKLKNAFQFDHVKQSLEDFDSRTVQSIRMLNYVTSINDFKQGSVLKDVTFF